VHFDAGTETRGRIEVREAQDVNPQHCVSLPATSCSAANWNAASPSNRLVTSFGPADLDVYSNVQMRVFLPGGTCAGNAVDICLGPLGRPYRRLSFIGTFAPMNDVPYVEVSPVDGLGLTRTVLIVPNGASRLAL